MFILNMKTLNCAGMSPFQAAHSHFTVLCKGCKSLPKGERLSSSAQQSGYWFLLYIPILPLTVQVAFVSTLKMSTDLVCANVCVSTQPEAISGSSRMKGGSATKILLEVVLSAAHAATFSHTPITRK